MNEADFIKKVSNIITDIVSIIEENNSNLELDINNDILSIETEDGVFVINKQTFLREIWLSSPLSGPSHFGYNNGRWLSSNNDELFEVLFRDLGINFK